MNFPNGKWGYKEDLDQCIGLTIQKAEYVRMEHGCVWSHASVVLFTDGTKAFVVGGKGSGIMNPDIEGMKESSIFTPEEVGEMVAAEKRKRDSNKRAAFNRELNEYKTLKKKFEGGRPIV